MHDHFPAHLGMPAETQPEACTHDHRPYIHPCLATVQVRTMQFMGINESSIRLTNLFVKLLL